MTIEERAASLAANLDVERAAVQRDLENLVSYRVPIEEAVQTLERKYGSSDVAEIEPNELRIAEIQPTDTVVTVRGMIASAGRRRIHYQGEDQVITEGEIADDTGRISYTAWEEFGIDPGDTVRIEHATVREWDGRPELNLGARTRIQHADEPMDLDIDIGAVQRLSEITRGDRDVRLEVRILECEERVVDGRAGETTIVSGVLGDASARRPFTDWEARSILAPDTSVRIENAYVSAFRGIPSVNLSEYSTITPLHEPVDVRPAGTRTSIMDAIDAGGRYDIEVLGNVVDVGDGSGLIERCPECARVIRRGRCRTHGSVDGEPDLRTKAIIDDGTAAATAILDTDLTASIYGGGVADALERARDVMDHDVVGTELTDRLLGRVCRVRGQLSVDAYGANIEATECTVVDNDPATSARAALDHIEVIR